MIISLKINKQMKIVLFTTILIGLQTFASAQDNDIKWLSFKEAQELNQKDPKPFFIDVYTDRCGWCKKLDKTTLRDTTVVAFMNTYFYAIKFDAESFESIQFNNQVYENKGNGRRPKHELAKALLNNKMSFPSLVFLNENLQILTVIGGYVEADEFSIVLEFLGAKKYLTQTYEVFSASKKKN